MNVTIAFVNSSSKSVSLDSSPKPKNYGASKKSFTKSIFKRISYPAFNPKPLAVDPVT